MSGFLQKRVPTIQDEKVKIFSFKDITKMHINSPSNLLSVKAGFPVFIGGIRFFVMKYHTSWLFSIFLYYFQFSPLPYPPFYCPHNKRIKVILSFPPSYIVSKHFLRRFFPENNYSRTKSAADREVSLCKRKFLFYAKTGCSSDYSCLLRLLCLYLCSPA